ncbi:MAG: hypothetical protein ETSY1_16750 [Candidatus Entotheonella factor]|uniref:N-acetyltransferase domain-containing protein n=1 Tax=Entotheonella factor TaxID=1429438 RepID=W4LLI3_ENTF1|nr:MAG: hypothetical protein ETSY1_16750 [Candidatus Entotheonella factor]
MHIYPQPSASQAIELLTACGLPTSDLKPEHFEHFLGCGGEAHLEGLVGLEIHRPDGLLRSLAVTETVRHQGCGKALVAGIEALARSQHLRTLYLLTDTAEAFFERLGYTRVARETVPLGIQQTEEFSSLCPDDAAVMKKELER